MKLASLVQIDGADVVNQNDEVMPSGNPQIVSKPNRVNPKIGEKISPIFVPFGWYVCFGWQCRDFGNRLRSLCTPGFKPVLAVSHKMDNFASIWFNVPERQKSWLACMTHSPGPSTSMRRCEILKRIILP